MFDDELLSDLGKRYRLFILTGRYKEEYEPVWSELDNKFEQVYCVDDFGEEAPKPSGDMLKSIMAKNQLKCASYVGNSIDDIQAARDAGISAIGVTSNMPKQKLLSAGADYICSDINDLTRLFKL